jgi:hypothetical protein
MIIKKLKKHVTTYIFVRAFEIFIKKNGFFEFLTFQ